jgi:hypothetical protein
VGQPLVHQLRQFQGPLLGLRHPARPHQHQHRAEQRKPLIAVVAGQAQVPAHLLELGQRGPRTALAHQGVGHPGLGQLPHRADLRGPLDRRRHERLGPRRTGEGQRERDVTGLAGDEEVLVLRLRLGQRRPEEGLRLGEAALRQPDPAQQVAVR